MNERIRACCGYQKEITSSYVVDGYLCEFSDLQKKYSGALMCEIDEKKYYYPRFVAKREDRDYPVTENTRYRMEPLGKDANGVYLGIKVTAYENEKDAKIAEINKQVKKYSCSYCTREQLDEILGKYSKFQSENSGKFLCKDTFRNKEIYCPNFTYELKTGSFEASKIPLDASNVRWQTCVLRTNLDGIYPGIECWPFQVPLGKGTITTTRDLLIPKEEVRDSLNPLGEVRMLIPELPVFIK